MELVWNKLPGSTLLARLTRAQPHHAPPTAQTVEIARPPPPVIANLTSPPSHLVGVEPAPPLRRWSSFGTNSRDRPCWRD